MAEVENVAGNDDVRAAKEDEGVAVGVRRRLIEHLNAIAIEIQRPDPRAREGFRRPASRRERRLVAGAHSGEHVFMRHDARGAGVRLET